MKYRTKVVEIEAHLWDGDHNELFAWAKSVSDGNGTGIRFHKDSQGEVLSIETWEGNMVVSLGDYVVCGLEGEFYPCKPSVFHKKYEVAK